MAAARDRIWIEFSLNQTTIGLAAKTMRLALDPGETQLNRFVIVAAKIAQKSDMAKFRVTNGYFSRMKIATGVPLKSHVSRSLFSRKRR